MINKSIIILVFGLLSGLINAATLDRIEQSIVADKLLIKPIFQLTVSEKVVEAIDNGIVITFVSQANLIENVNWWFDKNLVSAINTFQVRYFSLMSLYQLHNTRTDEKLSFVSLNELLTHLGEEIVFEFDLNPVADYFELRIFLDKQALPSIMQLPNVFDPDWNFSSDWHEAKIVETPKDPTQ